MEKTLQVLDALEHDGIISRYAIGGAMAATFYAEPVLTFDLDVFVILPQAGGGLLTLGPLYEALRRRGYAEEGECVLREQASLDPDYLRGVLARHGLEAAWKQWTP